MRGCRGGSSLLRSPLRLRSRFRSARRPRRRRRGANACGPSSTRLPTGSDLRRSSRRTTCRARSTTSPSLRSPRKRRRSARINRGASARSARTSTLSPRSATTAGLGGSPPTARAGTTRASRRERGWPRRASTSAPATRGPSTSRRLRCAPAHGAARQNLRDLVRGLYTGDGGRAVKGIVFVVGVGQSSTSLPTYKGTLQLWFDDDAFWNDMSAYVERLVTGGLRRRDEVLRRRRHARRAA